MYHLLALVRFVVIILHYSDDGYQIVEGKEDEKTFSNSSL